MLLFYYRHLCQLEKGIIYSGLKLSTKCDLRILFLTNQILDLNGILSNLQIVIGGEGFFEMLKAIEGLLDKRDIPENVKKGNTNCVKNM